MANLDNKELIKKYPFLQYRNIMSGELIPLEELDSTYLDDISIGWRQLTLQLFDNIMNHLTEIDDVPDFFIIELKSKYGYGHLYYGGGDEYIFNLVRKWEHDTSITCELCGEPAEWVSEGWIAPYCSKCKDEYLKNNPGVKFTPVGDGVSFSKGENDANM